MYSDKITPSGVPRDKFIRVFHAERPNADQWWKNLCDDPRYNTVGVGSGIRGLAHHDYLVGIAHRKGKRVHMLGAAGKMLSQIAYDTMDVSSHLSGGRFGKVMTPYGLVYMGSGKNSTGDPLFTELPKDIRQEVIGYWKSKGLTISMLMDSPYIRNLNNIWYMNEYLDKPFVESSKGLDLFRNTHFEI